MSTTAYRSKRPNIKSSNVAQSNYVTAYFDKTKKLLFSQIHMQNIAINPSATQPVIDIEENGELAFWEVTMDQATAVPFFTIYGDDETSGFINDLSANGLVAKGRGMCPGDIKLVAGVSPDKAGNIIYNSAYVARYKSDTTADALGNTSAVFTIRFLGQLPVPYRRFTLSVQNTNSTTALNVSDVYIVRTIFVQLPAASVTPEKALEREGEQDVIPGQEDTQGYAPPQMTEWIQGGYKPR